MSDDLRNSCGKVDGLSSSYPISDILGYKVDLFNALVSHGALSTRDRLKFKKSWAEWLKNNSHVRHICFADITFFRAEEDDAQTIVFSKSKVISEKYIKSLREEFIKKGNAFIANEDFRNGLANCSRVKEDSFLRQDQMCENCHDNRTERCDVKNYFFMRNFSRSKKESVWGGNVEIYVDIDKTYPDKKLPNEGRPVADLFDAWCDFIESHKNELLSNDCGEVASTVVLPVVVRNLRNFTDPTLIASLFLGFDKHVNDEQKYEIIRYILLYMFEANAITTEFKKGENTALKQMSEAMGHEVTKVYSTAYRLLLRAEESATSKKEKDWAIKIGKAAMQYGMLWGSSSHSEIPPKANFWEEGNSCREYIKCIVREGWHLYLVSEIFRGIQGLDMCEHDMPRIKKLWDAGDWLSDCVAYDEDVELMKPEKSSYVSVCLYRWWMAVIPNTWKHLVNAVSTENVSVKLDHVLGVLSSWRGAGLPDLIEIKFSDCCFPGDVLGAKINVLNDTNLESANMAPPQKKSTYLVMLLAAQELSYALNESGVCSMEEAVGLTEFSCFERKWSSSVSIPGLFVL